MGATSAAVRDGRHRFAAALQSTLTIDEVELAFIESVPYTIPAPCYGVYRLDPESSRMLKCRTKVDVNFLDEYEDFGRGDDPVLDFVLRQQRPIDSSRVVKAADWDRSGARTALRVGGYYHSLEAPLFVSGVLYGTMNFARPQVHPSFSSTDLVSARGAAEQLGLAIERALRYEVIGQRTSMLEHVLDRLPQAVIVTDLDARVIFRNRVARADASGDSGAASSTALIEESIAEAMDEFRCLGKRIHTRTAWDAIRQRRIIIKSFRLPDRDDAAMTLVFECADKGSARLPAWDVLSRREQEIAELVSQGLTNKQIAERSFISENTVKEHLKRVFAKTDVRNRAELMQRIWTAESTEFSAD